jgi:hypothetical protein
LNAFLALLGTLRCLRVARPEWRVRSWWEGADPRPTLEIEASDSLLPTEQLVEALAEGLRWHGDALIFTDGDGKPRKNPDFKPAEYRALLQNATASGRSPRARDPGLRRDALAALACELVKAEPKGTVEPTPYCLMSGSGHQHFLESWAEAPKLPPKQEIALWRALTEPWEYREGGLSFRWDPAEDRRYALRADDPSGSAPATCDAANRLAGVGLLSLSVLPTGRNLLAPGVRMRQRRVDFCWPIWEVPLPERAVLSLLRNPFVLHGTGARPAGLKEVRVARREQVGRFKVVTAGAPRA